MSDSDTHCYLPLGDGAYRPTRLAQGVWRDDEQHPGPVTGLLAHRIESLNPRPDLQLASLTIDILGVIPLQPCLVRCTTVRAGRTIELDEATMSVGGREVVRARAWRLARGDTAEVAGGAGEGLPPPEAAEPWDLAALWGGGGYVESLEVRRFPGRPGRGRVWLRSSAALVAEEDVGAAAVFVSTLDAANGIATRVPPGEWIYPNVDLSIHLHRAPQPGWIGLDTRVVFGAQGLGLTSSTAHDQAGPVARIAQSLTVRALK